MNIMNFSKANCSNCYKCVRTCSVKAIKVVDNQAEIVEELCTTCGHCLSVCPQNAREIHSDLEVVKNKLKEGNKLNISIAPSFRGFYEDSEKLIRNLKRLGFNKVEETAIGADITSKLYRNYIKSSNQSVFITTCCPSVILLIEKYYPEVIPYLMPFTSPMISHGYSLKNRYVDEETVFLGPCIAKKGESLGQKNKGSIDYVLTFDEISKWIQGENLEEKNLEVDRYGSNFGTSYPIVGGILEGIKEVLQEKKLIQLKIDGAEECKEVFNEVRKGNIKNACIEVSACKKSCLGGPSGSSVSSSVFKREQNLRNYLWENHKKVEIKELEEKLDLSTFFSKRKLSFTEPSEKEIKEILLTLEKYKEEDYLNCGGCGYNTCREKAVSIYKKMSHKEMCIHYMKKQAEKLSNEIFENSPNGILIIDDTFKVLESNLAFSRYFGIRPDEVKTLEIDKIVKREELEEVIESRKTILWEKKYFEEEEMYMRLSVLKMETKDNLIVFLTNVTNEELKREEIKILKSKTLKITKDVVEKQMRIAQDIASLLGETTAETKVAFNNLRDVFEKEGDL